MGNNGFIHLWRKSLCSGVFKSEGLWKVWCWCLLKASYKARTVCVKTGKGETEVKLLPGQFIYGRHAAAKELCMKSSTVQGRMAKLKSLSNIDIQPVTHYSIITITNWGSYQGAEKKSDTQSVTQSVTNNKVVKKEYISVADRIIEELNRKAGKNFKFTDNNRKLIIARLKEGYTEDDCRAVINNQLYDPYFNSNPKYMRPQTLFSGAKFGGYLENKPRKEDRFQ